MIKHKQQQICSYGESGFTIIESLVAILVVAVLLTAIAPTIVIATATRIQSKRVELATQASRTFIDGVKTGAVDVSKLLVIELDLPSSTTTRKLEDNLLSTTNMKPPDNLTKSTVLYCLNQDRTIVSPGCNSDLFYIQAAQVRVKNSNQPNDGYRLGIRVYRSDIDFTKTVNASDSSNKKTQNTFTGGLGDRQSPLLEMTTDIASRNTSFSALCQRLAITSNSTSNSTCN